MARCCIPLLFLLVAYSLSAGNAGTGFRYRTHLVTLAIAVMAILREQAMVARAQSRARRPHPVSATPRASDPPPRHRFSLATRCR